MATFRRIALGAALLAAAAAGAANAQTVPGGRHGRMGPGGQGMEFLHSLNLTETQRTQVRAIHEKYAPQLKAIHEQAMRETLAILTPEQRAKADTKIAARIKHLDGQKSRLEKLRR